MQQVVSRGRRRRGPARRAAGQPAQPRDRGRPRRRPAQQGIKPGDVRRAEATLLQGIEVGSVFEDQKVFEVIVQGHARDPPQRGERAQPADRQARRRSRPPRRRRRRARRADAGRDQAGRRLALPRRRSRRQRAQRRRRRERHREPAREREPAARVPRGGAAADHRRGDQLGPHARRSRSAARSPSSCCCRPASAAGGWRCWRSSRCRSPSRAARSRR